MWVGSIILYAIKLFVKHITINKDLILVAEGGICIYAQIMSFVN